MLSLIFLCLVVVLCAAAPLYAAFVARGDAFASDISGSISLGGEDVAVMQADESGFGVTPIGPTWRAQYFLGADGQGRDVMSAPTVWRADRRC